MSGNSTTSGSSPGPSATATGLVGALPEPKAEPKASIPSPKDQTNKVRPWPLKITPVACEPTCHAFTWEVADEALLVKYLAQLIAGHYLHVARVLKALGNANLKDPHPTAIKAAIEKLSPPKNDQQIYHRDGWLFQFIAWIASLQWTTDKDLVRAPQIRKAEHGIDGLIIHLAPGNEIDAGVRICEQKATESPRSLIHTRVWPEFKTYESGARANEILAEVTSLLQQTHDHETAIDLAHSILWEHKRSYSVFVTIDDKHSGASGHKKLFDGYPGVVQGATRRRRGETFEVADIRDWMEKLASKILNELNSMLPNPNV